MPGFTTTSWILLNPLGSFTQEKSNDKEEHMEVKALLEPHAFLPPMGGRHFLSWE